MGEHLCQPDDLVFSPHGIVLKKRFYGRYQLAVINNMPLETLEMFELITDDDSWEIKWMGCLDAPKPGYFNDVALMRDGSLFATHIYDKGTPIGS